MTVFRPWFPIVIGGAMLACEHEASDEGLPSGPSTLTSASAEDTTPEGEEDTSEEDTIGEPGSPAFCYRNKVVGSYPLCECFADEQDRSAATWDVAATCGGTPDLVCFADLRTSGDADSCACFQPGCVEDDSGYCECTNGQVSSGALDNATAQPVDACTPTSEQRCCAYFDDTHCFCNADGTYCSPGGNVREVDGCDPSLPVEPTSNQTPVTSCQDLSD